MTDVLKMSRKALTVGVVLTTILWSMMASVLVAPLKASAAGCTNGALIKGSLSAVYYCGADGKRYVFPNEKTYFTWYSDFSAVMTISDADLANIQIGGNVTYRPGVKLVKIQSDPKTYAVSKGGVLHWVTTEALAVCLYGSDWNTNDTHDIPDVFFTNYSIGSPILACGDYNPTAEMSASQSINQDKGLTGPPPATGFSASLASDTPSAATVPGGAVGVNFLKFNVSNGTGAALTVDSVTLRRVGPGSTSDFENVYLFEGDTRLTTGRTVNSSSNEVAYSSLNLSLAAGQTRTLWVAANISAAAAAGNVHAFELVSLMSGTTSASGLPIRGNNMTLAGTDVGTITIARSGALTNPKVGQLNAKIGEFQLTAGATEDLEVKRITLFQGGNLSRSNLTNLKLKTGGTDVASAAGVNDRDRVVFVITGTNLLEKGNTRTYEVWADIGGGARANDTIRLYAEEDVDVYALGKTFGYGADTVRTAYDNSANDGTDASWTTVEGGQITITFNGPASRDIGVNSKDQEVFNFTIASQSNVEVRNLRMRITPGSVGANDGLVDAGDSAPNFTDIKVTDTSSGATVAGPKDVLTAEATDVDGDGDTDPDDDQNVTFTDTFNLSAGQSRTFKVTLDVANEASLDGDTIRMDLLAFQSNDIRNLDNSTFVATTDIVPSSTITGNTMTIRLPSLTVSTASTPVAQTYVQGSQNVDLAGINLKAGDAGAMKVTAITVQMRVDANNDGTFANGCENNTDTGATDKFATDILLTAKLMKDGGTVQVGDTKSPTTSTASCTTNDGGLLQYTNLNLDIAAGQTVTLLLRGNLSSSIANLNDTIDFTVTGSTQVTAQDADGNSRTPSGSVNSPDMIITGNGVMTYTKAPDDTESEAGLVIGGTTAVLAKYRFTAQNEELKLSKVRMALPSGSATAVNSMSLYDGSTLVAGPTAVTTSGTSSSADFSGFSFVVPKDGSKTLTVKAVINTVGSGGAASGLDLTTTLCNGDATGAVCGADSNTYEVRGTSTGSNTIDTQGDSGDVAGNEKRSRKTKPTVGLASLPTSTLSNGTQVLSRFTVTADSAQQVSMHSIAWELNLNNVGGVGMSATSPAIREVGQGSDLSASNTSESLNCTTGAGAASVTCTVRLVLTTEQTVSAGTSKTYELRATIAGADTAGESISAKLLGDTAQVTGELDGANMTRVDDLDGANAPGTYNFVWSDNSSIPHNDTGDAGAGDADGADDPDASNDWTNGRFVKVLPSDVQTMSR